MLHTIYVKKKIIQNATVPFIWNMLKRYLLILLENWLKLGQINF